MDQVELNKILIHAVSNGWSKKCYVQDWYSNSKTYKDTCDIFEIMEIKETLYEGVSPSKESTGQIPTILVTLVTKMD